MATDRLNELYKDIYSRSPAADFEKLQQTDLYKLWQQHNQEAEASPPARIGHLIRDPQLAIAIILGALFLIITGIIMLIIDRRHAARNKRNLKPSSYQRASGTITRIVMHQEGKKARLDTPFYVDSSPVHSIAQWFMIIGITTLLIVIL